MKQRRVKRSQRRGPVVGGGRPRNFKGHIHARQVALVITAQEEVAEEKEKEVKD